MPSGWHHTVTNLEDTLSINHNWLNAFNLHWGWALLRREHAEAAAAIEDCRSVLVHVTLLLWLPQFALNGAYAAMPHAGSQ